MVLKFLTDKEAKQLQEKKQREIIDFIGDSDYNEVVWRYVSDIKDLLHRKRY